MIFEIFNSFGFSPDRVCEFDGGHTTGRPVHFEFNPQPISASAVDGKEPQSRPAYRRKSFHGTSSEYPGNIEKSGN
jgi:hypothetical protein